MEQRQFYEQLLRVTFRQQVLVVVPLAALQVHTVAEAAIFGLGSHIGVLEVVSENKLEAESVDSDLATTGTVLHSACQEGLGEEESRNPEHVRGSVVVPVLQEVDSLLQVFNPRGKRFQR